MPIKIFGATTDRFDIQARAEGNPGKDQMRLMMRSLLADRFKLAIHHETRQVPAFAIVLVKPGKTGPQLQLHPNDAPCPTTSSAQDSPQTAAQESEKGPVDVIVIDHVEHPSEN